MGSGTEIQWCVAAYEKLKAEGIKARVVSMPCWELFEQQDATYIAVSYTHLTLPTNREV